MTKNQKREIATSLTTFTFLIIGITGIMMFFHVFDKYTKSLHEILGLVFVAAVLFHVIFNFKSMKQYFSKKIFLTSGIASVIVSLAFILNVPEGENPKKVMIESLLKTDIKHSFMVLAKDMDLVAVKLKDHGIEINEEKTILQIAKANKKSPFEIIEILSK